MFVYRRDNSGRGHPVRASCEWMMYEEQRIYLERFYQTPKTGRIDLYSRVFRRSMHAMIGRSYY